MIDQKSQKPVIYWLLTGCLLLFIMVVVGGITRLTNSGLSMSDWHLVTDTFLPSSDAQWEAEFEIYKQYPEYQKINQHKADGFSLDDFKFIYFWEWFHRFIGRIIGLVFIIPFLYFLFTKRLSKSTLKKCLVLLFMGGFQGFLGWFMVKSGLVDRPDVSHYRLALHLTFAFLTFAYTLWVALDLLYPQKTEVFGSLKKLARISFVLLIVQIIYGGFVAGLNAGLVHNHWPLMTEGKLLHETVWIEETPLINNFLEGKSGVQFVHRTLAYIVVFSFLFLWWKSKSFKITLPAKNGLNVLLLFVFIQFLLGVFTLLYQVPFWLGLIHQAMAFLLLSAMTFSLHRLSK